MSALDLNLDARGRRLIDAVPIGQLLPAILAQIEELRAGQRALRAALDALQVGGQRDDEDACGARGACQALGVSYSTLRRLLLDPSFSRTYYRPTSGVRSRLVFSRKAMRRWREGKR